MTTNEGNAYIAKFLGIKVKSDGKTFELPIEFQKILNVKTTNNIPFNDNLELLLIAIEKINSVKHLWTTTQFQDNNCYVCLFYKSELIEGEWRNSKFSCERNKPIIKFKQALFEVLSTFCGWYYDHPECQTDIEYELDCTRLEEGKNVIYMKPKEVICPKCGRIHNIKEEE